MLEVSRKLVMLRCTKQKNADYEYFQWDKV